MRENPAYALTSKPEERRDLLPGEHLVDKGYTDSEVLVASQREYGVTIVGRVADVPGWQARAGAGFDTGSFVVDWDRLVVTCTAGAVAVHAVEAGAVDRRIATP